MGRKVWITTEYKGEPYTISPTNFEVESVLKNWIFSTVSFHATCLVIAVCSSFIALQMTLVWHLAPPFFNHSVGNYCEKIMYMRQRVSSSEGKRYSNGNCFHKDPLHARFDKEKRGICDRPGPPLMIMVPAREVPTNNYDVQMLCIAMKLSSHNTWN